MNFAVHPWKAKQPVYICFPWDDKLCGGQSGWHEKMAFEAFVALSLGEEHGKWPRRVNGRLNIESRGVIESLA